MTYPIFTRVLAITVVALAITKQAKGDPIPTLFNTGVDNSGVLIAGPAVDPHYTLISSADPSFPGPQARIPSTSIVNSGPFLDNGPSSSWISPSTNLTPEPAGNYVYRTTFDLTGFDPSTAVITGRWSIDDFGTSMKLNSTETGNTQLANDAYTFWKSFTITSGFVSGINTLDFTINNVVWTTGLRVELSGTAAVPEPGASFPVILGLMAYLLRRGRSMTEPAAASSQQMQ